ncbi:MAG TPA: ABC-type transport auxiliary lipoprotein family protein [Candidatus Hydrogenedens sp.]|nr:ABC-type transport auxiliary lipoprotein family protein [Candidatus Hydrogenedens sp.]
MKERIIISTFIISLFSMGFWGCLTPVKTEYLVKYYINPSITEMKGEYTGLVLAIRGLENARSITNFVTFLEQGKIYYREGLEWAEHPVEVVERLLIKSIEKTGRFQDVSNSIEVKNPDLILTGEIEQFYCVRENNSEKVVVSINIRIRDAKTSKIVFNKAFVVEEQFDKEKEQINDAMNNALSELSQQIQKEINKADFK